MELLRANGIIKRQNRKFELGPLDLVLHTGEVWGIAGGKESGKSTLLRLLWGFLRPDQGSLSVLHYQPHLEQIALRRFAGYVPAAPIMDSWRSVRRHLEFISGFYDNWNESTARSLLKTFRIDPDKQIGDLGDSAKIKLALLCAASHNPLLLLLDEPLARMDAATRHEISTFLKKLAVEQGIGIVVSSKSVSDLDQLPDVILMLTNGKAAAVKSGPSLRTTQCRQAAEPPADRAS